MVTSVADPSITAYFTHPKAQNVLSTVSKTIYKTYVITYAFNANEILVDEQVDQVLQWKNAEMIRFNGDDGVIFKALQQRLDELTQLQKLSQLIFDYEVQLYTEIKVRDFIERLPVLNEISFKYRKDLNETEKKFFASQIPSGWSFGKGDGGSFGKGDDAFLVFRRVNPVIRSA